jgi:hypothetical protein
MLLFDACGGSNVGIIVENFSFIELCLGFLFAYVNLRVFLLFVFDFSAWILQGSIIEPSWSIQKNPRIQNSFENDCSLFSTCNLTSFSLPSAIRLRYNWIRSLNQHKNIWISPLHTVSYFDCESRGIMMKSRCTRRYQPHNGLKVKLLPASWLLHHVNRIWVELSWQLNFNFMTRVWEVGGKLMQKWWNHGWNNCWDVTALSDWRGACWIN